MAQCSESLVGAARDLQVAGETKDATTTPAQADPGVCNSMGKHTGHASETDVTTGSHRSNANGGKGPISDA